MGKLKDVTKEVNVDKVKEQSRGFIKEFTEFAMKGNVVDLAIGMIIGSAFTSITKSLVDDIIMPVIGILTGGFDFSQLFIQLGGDVEYATLEAAKEAGVAVLTYGNFLTAVLNFLIVAMVIFIVFKKLLAPKKKVEEPAAPTTKECAFCKSTIHIEATRCPHCTSEL